MTRTIIAMLALLHVACGKPATGTQEPAQGQHPVIVTEAENTDGTDEAGSGKYCKTQGHGFSLTVHPSNPWQPDDIKKIDYSLSKQETQLQDGLEVQRSWCEEELIELLDAFNMEEGNIGAVKKYIDGKKGSKSNLVIECNAGDWGVSAMHMATLDLDLAALMLSNGADPNIYDSSGNQPIHWAIENGQYDVVKLLLQAGASIEATDIFGESLLLQAVKMPSVADNLMPDDEEWAEEHALAVEMVEYLISQGAAIDVKTTSGETLLHGAAYAGSPVITELLLEKGLDVNATTDECITPLHEATGMSNTEVVRVLLQHGANVDARNSEGLTPVQETDEEEILELIESLQ